MLHWSLLLSAYNYELLYVPGSKTVPADVFSHLPLPATEEHEPPLGDVLLIKAAPEVPLGSVKIAALTRTRPILSRVHCWTLQGWPAKESVSTHLWPERMNFLSQLCIVGLLCFDPRACTATVSRHPAYHTPWGCTNIEPWAQHGVGTWN